MRNALKILILEDNHDDADIIREVILKAELQCKFFVATNRESFLDAIHSFLPDVILSDNSLPQFDSEEALQLTRLQFPHLPFILVTGTVSEEYAVKITKKGADDYILKDRLARLPASIYAALAHRESELQLQKIFEQNQLLAERMSAILNTIPANIALLDNSGNILEVNAAWKKFASENGYPEGGFCIGINYIEVCLNASGKEKRDGIKVATGIRAILDKTSEEFLYEYECHSPNAKRWYRMIVTPLAEIGYAGAVVMHLDITLLKNMESERMESKINEQKKITAAMLEAQEKERNLIGRELHDNVNQILAGTKLTLSTALIYPAKKKSIIENAIVNLDGAIDENRKLAHELVAPDFRHLHITDQLRMLTQGMLKKAGIFVRIVTKNFTEDILEDDKKLMIYRIVQEQCTNILKHSRAANVRISLKISGDTFSMNIEDDGCGVERSGFVNGIGLRNIRSRTELYNGVLSIESAAGEGFKMKVTIPVK